MAISNSYNINHCFSEKIICSSQRKNAKAFPWNCWLLKLFLYRNLMGRIRIFSFSIKIALFLRKFILWHEWTTNNPSILLFQNLFALLNTFAKVILLFVTFPWNIFMSCQGHQKILVCIREKKHCYNQMTTSVRVHFLSLSFDEISTKIGFLVIFTENWKCSLTAYNLNLPVST